MIQAFKVVDRFDERTIHAQICKLIVIVHVVNSDLEQGLKLIREMRRR